MKKPIIGISTRIVSPKNYEEKRDAISHDLVSILDKLGLNPILIPNNLLRILPTKTVHCSGPVAPFISHQSVCPSPHQTVVVA